MCGLFGILGQGINRDDCNFFKDIMIFSAVRGTDATGVACGSSHNKGYVFKKATDPIWFLQHLTNQEEKDIDNVSYNYFLGHTRWATKGEKTVSAAQPFEYSRITGTHNGTLDNNWDGFNSDSDAMFSKINSVGIKDTIKGMKPNDAYAIVYYDRTDKSVNFIHNGKRKLYFALNEKRNTLYYASENGMLIAALWRNGIKDTIKGMKPNDAYAIVYYDRTDKSVNFIHNGKRKLYFALNEKRNTLYYASENGMLIAALWRNGIEAKPFYFTEDHLVSIKPHDLKRKQELCYTSTKLVPITTKDDKAPFDGGVDTSKEGPSVDV